MHIIDEPVMLSGDLTLLITWIQKFWFLKVSEKAQFPTRALPVVRLKSLLLF